MKWPSKASITEESPLIMLSVVKALGASSRARSRLGSWRSETTRAPVGDTSRQRSRMRRRPGAAGLVTGVTRAGRAQRAITVSPATTRSPVETSRSHSGGTKTSIREPNFISPTRWPVASSSPSLTRVTTRRAIRPTIWRKCTRRSSSPTCRST